MSIRSFFFWLHLIGGCVAGAVILLMSVTGVLLMYERQMIARSERGTFAVEPGAGASRLPLETVLNGLGKALPPNATVVIRAGAGEPIEITGGRDGALYVNPYDGRVLGRAANSSRPLFQKLRAWHRWIGVEGSGRATTKAITGAANLIFLYIVMSGLYLWLPRQWTARHLRPVVWFTGGVSGKARDFNWHNVFGLWCCVPLFFVVISAVPISYSWGTDLVYRVTGTKPPPRPAPRPKVDTPAVDQLLDRARRQEPSWRSIAFALSDPGLLTIDTGDGGQPQKRSTLTLDPATGAVVKWQTFADNNAGQRLRLWMRFTHTGEAFGLAGQTLAGVASAGAVMLVWTGIALALRRFAAWRRRRSRA